VSAAAIDAVLIEGLADRAWPAAEQVPLPPWKLRATHGVTRRANSVFTAGGGNVDDLEELVAVAEGFFARRSLPPVFQVSEGTGARGLDDFLAGRGYRVDGASEVWTRELGRVRGGTATSAPPKMVGKAHPTGAPAWEIVADVEPDAAWFDCAFDEPAERRRVHEQIVRRVPRPRLFVSARLGDVAIGCGMATSAAGHAGVFAMSTRPAFRRRGIAAALLDTLCAWAAGRRDGRMFLQVMCENEGAKALYRRAGFGLAYRYHYRVR
jgi:ribosomal protein S18 acetylase RimI-like enzyme